MATQRCIFLTLTISSLIAFNINNNCIDALENVKNLQHFISTEKIEAEDYSSAYDPWNIVFNDCPDHNVFYIGDLFNTTVLKYQQVDFLYGMNRLTLHVANRYPNASLGISLHLGNYSLSPFVTFPVDYTGTEPCGFLTLNVDFDEPLTGAHDLIWTFDSGTQDYLHLDWFVFNRTGEGFTATDKIEAENFTRAYVVDVFHDCDDTTIGYVGDVWTTSSIVYESVDFGSGMQMVTLRVANAYKAEPLDIALHLGSASNAPIVTIPVGQTGSGRCDFYTLDAFLDTKPSGLQDLYITFPSSQGGYLLLDWFVFKQTLTHQ